ncbi:DUF4476 domain-containing protein [Lacibacter sp. H407]|uniref:DUF4476 domain-containing protein n=1 Tax=Lacibacter sp. H407 TaxID=3133423 RepID=UPI0030BC41B4
MRKLLISRFVLVALLLAAVGIQAQAQLNHFIYLQTDNQQPFYVKYNNRIISSSATGYLILSKLKGGQVDFAVGFPKSDQQEQQFQCNIEQADKGFLIKNFNEKGWGLYDLQSSSVLYAAVKTDPKINTSNVSVPPANDPFSNMLSKVTQDSTVKTVNVVKEPVVEKPAVVNVPTPVVTTPATTPVKDSITTIQTTTESEKPKEQPVVNEPVWIAPAKTPVKQIRKFESREGNDYVFEVQESNGVRDTVRLFIEKDSTPIPQVVVPVQPEVVKDTVAVVPPQTKEEPVKVEAKKDSIQVVVPKKEETVEKKEEIVQPVVPPVQKTEPQGLPNSNCKNFATEDDLIKLRRRMASQSKDEQMINEAKKAFQKNCFTSAQLKNLSVLFLSDEGRYRFFDAAMPFVTDFSNFKSLGETILDEYYKKRFLALLPNQ